MLLGRIKKFTPARQVPTPEEREEKDLNEGGGKRLQFSPAVHMPQALGPAGWGILCRRIDAYVHACVRR